MLRVQYGGREQRLFIAHTYPKCSLYPSLTTISYNGSFAIAGEILLDEYEITGLVNLSAVLRANGVNTVAMPITATQATYNWTGVQHPALYKGLQWLQVGIRQNGQVTSVNQTQMNVLPWSATVGAGDFSGTRDTPLRLHWSLTDLQGSFSGEVAVYLSQGGIWILLGTSTTGELEYILDLPEGEYSLRFEFSGDNIHSGSTTYAVLQVEEVNPWGKNWWWIVLVGAVATGTGVVVYRTRIGPRRNRGRGVRVLEVEEEPAVLEHPAPLAAVDVKSLTYPALVQHLHALPKHKARVRFFRQVLDQLDQLGRVEETLRWARGGPNWLGVNVEESCLYRQGKILIDLKRFPEAEARLLDGITRRRSRTTRIYDQLITVYRELGEPEKVQLFTQKKRF